MELGNICPFQRRVFVCNDGGGYGDGSDDDDDDDAEVVRQASSSRRRSSGIKRYNYKIKYGPHCL